MTLKNQTYLRERSSKSRLWLLSQLDCDIQGSLKGEHRLFCVSIQTMNLSFARVFGADGLC